MEGKSKVLLERLEKLSKAMAEEYGKGMSRSRALSEGRCASCGEKADEFRDEVSKDEYKLTAWCQSCQDSFFNT